MIDNVYILVRQSQGLIHEIVYASYDRALCEQIMIDMMENHCYYDAIYNPFTIRVIPVERENDHGH